VAQDDADSRIGLPEIKLGIHPGYGGSVRLIELIGVLPAMKLMLTGYLLSARSAQKQHIVDQIAPARHLRRVASELILTSPAKQKAPWWQVILSHKKLRPTIAKLLRKQTLKQVNPEHYPAPLALIELWQNRPLQRQQYFDAEALSVAKLLVTETAQNLVRLFFLRKRLKAFGKQSAYRARHVHVIGAGVMGGDIAAWCALQGLNVTLQDQSSERIAPAVKRAHKLFSKQLKAPHLVQAAMDRLSPDINGDAVAKADVVIEAIFENLEAKQTLYRTIEPKLTADAILATNTSSLSLESLSTCLVHPERLVGLHFFNPVAKMQLVEIVTAAGTASQWTEKAVAFIHQIDRLPLPVKSAPGFLINRILMPYLLEAVQMENDGIPPSRIDQAARDFGMPMGPIELADSVGLDICLSVAEILAPALEISIPDNLSHLVDQGHLGRKSGRGFYQYDTKGKIKPPTKTDTNTTTDISSSDISQRLILRLLNECAACLEQGIVADADLLDAGMVFGTGFAPFRGGPMHYVEQQGAATVVKQLDLFSQLYGAQFKPQSGWRQLL
jgi:3-hydroxyacyl-CoA dehydrogenase/enoyl-CoA hydratase/3-hydroxybutyryl-CoA epimerase